MRFPDSSVGKESTCNAEDPSLIPGSGRSAGEGIGYPLQYSWASLVTQLVKNLPAMQETWVQSLGWEDLLKWGNVTHSSMPIWRIPWTVVHEVAKSQTGLSNFHFHHSLTIHNLCFNMALKVVFKHWIKKPLQPLTRKTVTINIIWDFVKQLTNIWPSFITYWITVSRG